MTMVTYCAKHNRAFPRTEVCELCRDEGAADNLVDCAHCGKMRGHHIGAGPVVRCPGAGAPTFFKPAKTQDQNPIKKPSALDTQVGGDHYKKLGDYQPWEVLRRWLTPEEFRGFMKGTAIAYLAREKDKGGTQDIEKAMHTLAGFIDLEAKP